MKVRGDGLAKLSNRAVGIRPVSQIAEYLIERAIFLDDVDHVLDSLLKEPHHALAFGVASVEIVLGNPSRQPVELTALARHRCRDEGRALELELIFVRRSRRCGCGCAAVRVGDLGDRGRVARQMLGVRARDVLAIDDVHKGAILAERDVVRLVCCRDKAYDVVVRSPSMPALLDPDHRDRVRTRISRVQRATVG